MHGEDNTKCISHSVVEPTSLSLYRLSCRGRIDTEVGLALVFATVLYTACSKYIQWHSVCTTEQIVLY
jgi:hypothetical protein